MVVNRVFRKDQDVYNALSIYNDKDGHEITRQWDEGMLIRIISWDNISALNQGLITTTLLGFNYTFAYDT